MIVEYEESGCGPATANDGKISLTKIQEEPTITKMKQTPIESGDWLAAKENQNNFGMKTKMNGSGSTDGDSVCDEKSDEVKRKRDRSEDYEEEGTEKVLVECDRWNNFSEGDAKAGYYRSKTFCNGTDTDVNDFSQVETGGGHHDPTRSPLRQDLIATTRGENNETGNINNTSNFTLRDKPRDENDKLESKVVDEVIDSKIQQENCGNHIYAHDCAVSSKDVSNIEKKRKGAAVSGGKSAIVKPKGDPMPCPRCKSLDTKFCYYNNYNLKQPRYFCKSCQRYWTCGGTLRNVPFGAGKRKSKRSTINENDHFKMDPKPLVGSYWYDANPPPSFAPMANAFQRTQNVPHNANSAAMFSNHLMQGGISFDSDSKMAQKEVFEKAYGSALSAQSDHANTMIGTLLRTSGGMPQSWTPFKDCDQSVDHSKADINRIRHARNMYRSTIIGNEKSEHQNEADEYTEQMDTTVNPLEVNLSGKNPLSAILKSQMDAFLSQRWQAGACTVPAINQQQFATMTESHNENCIHNIPEQPFATKTAQEAHHLNLNCHSASPIPAQDFVTYDMINWFAWYMSAQWAAASIPSTYLMQENPFQHHVTGEFQQFQEHILQAQQIHDQNFAARTQFPQIVPPPMNMNSAYSTPPDHMRNCWTQGGFAREEMAATDSIRINNCIPNSKMKCNNILPKPEKSANVGKTSNDSLGNLR